jgi:hypothetical protein
MAERGRAFLAGELADDAACWAGWRALW